MQPQGNGQLGEEISAAESRSYPEGVPQAVGISGQAKSAFDRQAYQRNYMREYMRGYRARRKGTNGKANQEVRDVQGQV
jgi:hypothetical protein